MEALFSSTFTVALAEIGDKTQLLTLFLVARFAQRNQILLGILIATLVNHGLSAYLGTWLIDIMPSGYASIMVGISFILVGLWILIPDKDDDEESNVMRHGAFIATLVLFFLAEIGDKTQIATVILAAKYDAFIWVTLGTTLGMLIANVPVAYTGEWLMKKIPLHWVRWGACSVFCLLGILTLTFSQ